MVTENSLNKGLVLFKGEVLTKMQKWDGAFKNLFLKNHWARRAQIYMKTFWHNADSNFFKSWSQRVRRGLNMEIHIYTCLYWKKIFSRTSHPISIKLGIHHPWVKWIRNCSKVPFDYWLFSKSKVPFDYWLFSRSKVPFDYWLFSRSKVHFDYWLFSRSKVACDYCLVDQRFPLAISCLVDQSFPLAIGCLVDQRFPLTIGC
jgi:hypothetical protein